MSYPTVPAPSITLPDRCFAKSGEQFVVLLQHVLSAGPTTAEADLERMIDLDGRALLRQVLQDQLDRRAATESTTAPPAINPSLASRRSSSRQLQTVFGEVSVTRFTWKEADKDGVRPMDWELNLPPRRYSHVVIERLAAEVLKASFDSAIASLEGRGIDVPKRQAEEQVVAFSAHFDAFYESNAAVAAPSESALLILSFDGKGISMRHEDLRPETKKKAEKRGQRSRRRLSPGEKSNQKRMTEVGAIWWQEPVPRTVEDIMGDVDGERRGDAPKLGRAVGKRLVASVARGIPEVVASVFADAQKRDPKHEHRWVALVDGNPDQVAAIEASEAARGEGRLGARHHSRVRVPLESRLITALRRRGRPKRRGPLGQPPSGTRPSWWLKCGREQPLQQGNAGPENTSVGLEAVNRAPCRGDIGTSGGRDALPAAPKCANTPSTSGPAS